jgi:hypothetical protein
VRRAVCRRPPFEPIGRKRRLMGMTPPLMLAVLAIWSGPALGQPNAAVESAYTTFDSDKCRHTRGRDVEDYGSWLCRGYRDIPVWLAAGDQRMYVSFGRGAAREPAAGETILG